MMSTLRTITNMTTPAVPNGPATVAAPDRKLTACQRFDAFFMQAILEQALPKKADAVFGHGFSGDVMRSMLAEKVAVEFSKRSDLSIVGRVLMGSDRVKVHPLSGVSLEVTRDPVS